MSQMTQFFESVGTPCEARTGNPLCLQGSDAVWLVAAGKVDVFLARMRDGHPENALRPLFRVEVGQMLCGMAETAASADWALVAMGGPGNRLLRLDRARLQAQAQQAPSAAGQTAELLDHWLERLASPLVGLAPSGITQLEPDHEAYDAAPGEIFLARQQTLWVSQRVGEFRFLGRADATLPPGAGLFPLPRTSWLTTVQAGSLRALTSEAFLRQDQSWAGLDAFHNSVLACLITQAGSADEEERQRLAQKSVNEAKHIRNAMVRLSAILDKDGAPLVAEEGEGFPLLAACHLVGSASGMVFSAPPFSASLDDPKRDVLSEIVEASRLRRRMVGLKGAWWNQENGNLLGFIEDGNKPVALLQTATGYTLHDPVRGTAQPVTEEVAASLMPFGFVFYRSFGDTMVNLGEMAKFGSYGNARDILMVVMMGVAVGLLGLVTPLATGMLFDTVIPGAERGQLAQLTLALLAGAFATAMFGVTRGFAMLRAEGKIYSAIQLAVWDRLLRLPAPFFRDYSAGDLAMRANGINIIRQVLSGNILLTLLSAVFAVFNLFLLFYYSLKLALLGVVLVIVAILFTSVAGYLSRRHQRRQAEVQGRISGLVFQLLGSVAKLRTTGAEGRAFYNWAMLFAKQQEHQFKASVVNNVVEVFNSVFPAVASMSIFLFIAFFLSDDKTFSTGDFLAFNAAFGGFLGAMLGAIGVFTVILGITPIYERAKPILQTPPEITDSKAHPGQLSGEIEVSHLSFSYTADGPQILNDISLSMKPGEFVALVGTSGSGKSTLLRLLLGFETPSSGSIYYDHQDISGVDLGALRRQLGVVLQNGQLLSGDIFTNIIGAAAALTLDDAWEAATQVGIAGDIRDMPMGMHTVVSDGGGTLSGGQRQRLLIARAIVNRPRILFFDEATSALDNRAQEMVSTSLENLRATRIVIAHRLSTIINADRIFVMDGGSLVQSGTYEELIQVDGLFADLAKRQIV
jgi:NHLM bacteriocin system ABC transporter ATP-binding protein